MPFVMDASIGAALLLQDVQDPLAEAALERARSDPAYVPILWYSEMYNVLLTAARRGRISADAVDRFLTVLESLPVEMQPESKYRDVFQVAVHHSLTFYDATYLALAQACRIPLATKDRALARAATASGVPLLEG